MMNRFDEFDDDDTPMGENDELSFNDGVEIDKKLLASFKKTASSLGIPRAKAQKLATMYAGHIAESAQESDVSWGRQQRAWENEIENRPGFKQELTAARKVLRDHSDSAKLFPLLQESLLGSHPVFFDFVVRVATALSASSASSSESRTGGQGNNSTSGGGSAVTRMWPDKKPPARKPASAGSSLAERMWPDAR